MAMPRAVVIGPPGSGKSTVARVLAEYWGVRALDTDDEIVSRAGKDIQSIFLDDGEQAFRAMERKAVAESLSTHDGVLALGGGAVLDPSTQGDLTEYAARGGEVVFLDVGTDEAARRVGVGRGRPLLSGDVRRQWRTLMEDRRPVYERLATLIVLTDGRTPEEVARAIAEEGRPG